ncbi:MAG: alpha-L-fucosidase [Clostridia bacterium]|nr:alpha-L-fucosidase [Clostridia bacterium]
MKPANFTSNKFGMFIHWGFYSMTGLQEQALARFNLDSKEYELLMHSFDPVNFDPDKIVMLAKNAGMKYICFTAKHHDGFCMWDTKQTDYNIMHTPYRKDILKMLADACHRHGMLLSVYYSNPDWHEKSAYNPLSSHQWKSPCPEEGNREKYIAFVKAQITELLTGYGKIYTLFWDIPPRFEDRNINELARKLMPGILINNRGYDEGDFATPEREVPCGNRFDRMTEACQSVGRHSWGYRANEDYYSARFLMSSVSKIMAMGGSYLLNIGPKGDGSIPEKAEKLIERIGRWYMSLNGALESTEPDSYPYALLDADPFIAVKKEGKTFFHFHNGLSVSAVTFTNAPSVPVCARLVNKSLPLSIRYEKLPGVHDGKTGLAMGPYVSLTGFDADDYADEPVTIEVAWQE